MVQRRSRRDHRHVPRRGALRRADPRAEHGRLGGVHRDRQRRDRPNVDVLFNGHTHQLYAFDAPVPGVPGEFRPVLQTGNYGENVGKVVLTVDTTTKEILSYTRENIPRSTASDNALLVKFPALSQVKTIVDAALANAATVGNVPKGLVSNDITTAYTAGTFGPTGYQAPRITANRDQRNAESTLGGLVANASGDDARELRHRPADRLRHDRRGQPRRPPSRAVLSDLDTLERGQRRRHLRRGERRAAVREQPVDHPPDGCAVQDDARAAVAARREQRHPVPRLPAPRAVRERELHVRPGVARGIAHHLDHRRRRADRPGGDVQDRHLLVPRDGRRQLPDLHPGHCGAGLRSRRPRRLDRLPRSSRRRRPASPRTTSDAPRRSVPCRPRWSRVPSSRPPCRTST